MKKFTASLIIFSFLIVSFMSSCSNTTKDANNEIPALLERKADMGPNDETLTIKDSYNKAIMALKQDPDDMKQYIALASVYIAEGRITGNGSYYSNAAAKMLDKVITAAADNDLMFQALSLKSTVLLNMHQFKDALDVAKKGLALSAYNAGIYGALVDANVELGNYDEAVKNCEKLLGIRPDLRSYSRASYLRQIYGDNKGAIAAMKMAVEAGVPGAESTEWARVTLGDLYLNTGNVDSASIIYRTSLVYRPSYPYAEMGMARVEKAKGNYDAAIAHTKNAIGIMSEAAFVSALADLYELKGDMNKATEVRNDVVKLLEGTAKDEPKDVPIKHNVNREMANAYMAANQMDKAMQYAQNDLQMRPDNIDANELMAWVYYKKGDFANAKLCADKMLKLNTKNANSLYKAGLIYAAAGDSAKGNELMQKALAVSQYVDPKFKNSAKAA
jgi:tetratricopeptide (TPR) repeat protein